MTTGVASICVSTARSSTGISGHGRTPARAAASAAGGLLAADAASCASRSYEVQQLAARVAPARMTPTPCWPGWPAWSCGTGSRRPAGPTGLPCPCRRRRCAAAGRPCRRPSPSCSGTPRTWRSRRAGRADGRSDAGRLRRAPVPVPSVDGMLRIRGGVGGVSFQFEELLAGAAALDGIVRELAAVEEEAEAVRRALFPYQYDSYTSGSNAITAVGEAARDVGPRPDGAGASRQRRPGEPPRVRVCGSAERPDSADWPDRRGVRAPVPGLFGLPRTLRDTVEDEVAWRREGWRFTGPARLGQAGAGGPGGVRDAVRGSADAPGLVFLGPGRSGSSARRPGRGGRRLPGRAAAAGQALGGNGGRISRSSRLTVGPAAAPGW